MGYLSPASPCNLSTQVASHMRGLPDLFADLRAGVRYSVGRPHFIVVLGMHRSGTSLLSRTLSLMGASIGLRQDSRLVAPDGEIHWEPSSLIWINDEILARSGGKWDQPPPELRPSRRDLLRCRRFLWEYSGSRVAVFKDPRLCLTYPVWREVLPNHSIVVSIRHPMNVARSLERRDGMPIHHGLELWTHYNQRILECVDQGARVYWFDFDGGRAALQELARELEANLPLSASAEAIEHYDPAVHRFRGAQSLPPNTNRVFQQLSQRASEK